MVSINKYRPHVYVIPEDDANRQIAVGMGLDPSIDHGKIQILSPAGGWLVAVEKLLDVYVPVMKRAQEARVVLMIDCDNHPERIPHVKKQFASDFQDRIFIVGTLSEPEILKSAVAMSFEQIGRKLSRECATNVMELWKHPQLVHNADEVSRMVSLLKPFLFV